MNVRPIFDADALSGSELLALVQRDGAVLIRNCLDADGIEAMLQLADQAYAKWEADYNNGRLDASQKKAFEAGHVFPETLDSKANPFAIISFFVRSRLSRILLGLWDGNLLFLNTNCIPRRQHAGQAVNVPVPFHQDAAFLGNTNLVLNFWIPLTACGEDAPGLEVVAAHPDGLIERKLRMNDPLSIDYSGIEIPAEEVVRRFGADSLWHPVMQPGDVLVFSNLTIHRTYMHESMTKSRTSLEVRCTDGGDASVPWHRADLVPVHLKAKT